MVAGGLLVNREKPRFVPDLSLFIRAIRVIHG